MVLLVQTTCILKWDRILGFIFQAKNIVLDWSLSPRYSSKT